MNIEKVGEFFVMVALGLTLLAMAAGFLIMALKIGGFL